MGWVLLEILAALAIAVGIVWWTFPKRRDEEARAKRGADDEKR